MVCSVGREMSLVGTRGLTEFKKSCFERLHEQMILFEGVGKPHVGDEEGVGDGGRPCTYAALV